MFLENETFKPFINPNYISRSTVYRKYINKRNYRLSSKLETQKSFVEVKNLIESVLDISIKEEI
jgi:chromosome partitioning protein